MDAFSLLKADHRKVEELFERLEAADGKEKLNVFAEIKTELDLHAHIEEKIFYPALEKPKQTHDLTLEAYEEHDVVKKLLRELSRSKTANEEWEAKAKVLQENVEHHVQEEENELFKKASSVLSQGDIEELGESMEAEKERQQDRGAAKKSSAKKASARKASGKKSGAGNKSASKTTGASKAAKRTGTKKASTSKRGSGSKKSGSKKSAKKR
jgi:hemerythrin-like domain-containing protein